ncbi:MAG: YrhB domain-containing protein [Verrucomicrobiota bacterium]
MITREQAHDKAIQFIQQLVAKPFGPGGDNIVLNDAATQSYDFGWVFFWQNRKFLETRDTSFMLVGNAPLLVDRNTGALYVTGTGRSLEYYISNYRLTGDPHREPVWHLTFTQPEDSAKTREAVLLFRDTFKLPLQEAKQAVDHLLKGTQSTFKIGSEERAQQLSASFQNIGFPSQPVAK